MRITYNRELKFKDDLEDKGMEYFLPMTIKYVMKGSRKVRMRVPAIHNLMFVHCTKPEMAEYKRTTALPIRYIMNRENRTPMTIPEKQMHDFIAIAGTAEEQVLYLDYETAVLRKGERVRITGGIWKGAEGVLSKIDGNSRVMVVIPGVAAVATAALHPSLIEIIDKQ